MTARQTSRPHRVRVVGPGRAGGSMMRAMAEVGFDVLEPLPGRADVTRAGVGADVVLIATPDATIAQVAARVDPDAGVVVGHLAGSLGLEVLATHPRRMALHPLVSLPDVSSGARKLQDHAWFATAGDDMAREVVERLGGRSFEVADGDRAAYHAAAAIAANHLVALLGQVERVGASIDTPLEAYLDLAQGSLDSVRRLGPAAALTGPAARNDLDTLAAHRAALDPSELPAYDALLEAARRLHNHPDPTSAAMGTGSDPE